MHIYEKLLIMPISIKARIEKSVFVRYESRLQGSQGRGGPFGRRAGGAPRNLRTVRIGKSGSGFTSTALAVILEHFNFSDSLFDMH